MAKAEINAGICGMKTTVEAHMLDGVCNLTIESDCANIRRLAEELKQVNPYQEISHRRGGPLTLQTAVKYCPHAACPVPVGVIKAIEVEAKLALPANVSITVSHTEP